MSAVKCTFGEHELHKLREEYTRRQYKYLLEQLRAVGNQLYLN